MTNEPLVLYFDPEQHGMNVPHDRASKLATRFLYEWLMEPHASPDGLDALAADRRLVAYALAELLKEYGGE